MDKEFVKISPNYTMMINGDEVKKDVIIEVEKTDEIEKLLRNKNIKLASEEKESIEVKIINRESDINLKKKDKKK